MIVEDVTATNGGEGNWNRRTGATTSQLRSHIGGKDVMLSCPKLIQTSCDLYLWRVRFYKGSK